jgi:putative transposase
MPSTHLSLHYHLVFSTKNRERWLTPTIRERVHRYLGGTVRGLGAMPHAVSGIDDHVHVLFGLKATHCLADVMRELKSEFSAWIHRELGLTVFHWQEGYGAFTFGAPDMESVRRYVLNQEEHHRTKSFQEEYVEMLKRGLDEYDDSYLW